MYSQSIRSGYYLSLSAFIEYLVNYYETASFLSQIHYLNLINYYEKLFGKENVLVLCFEELIEDEDLFLSKICEFIEVKNINIKLPKRNPGLGKLSILIQRLLNRIVTYDLGRPHFSPGVRLPGKRGHSLEVLINILPIELLIEFLHFYHLIQNYSFQNLGKKDLVKFLKKIIKF